MLETVNLQYPTVLSVKKDKVAVVTPTLNAERSWLELLEAITCQGLAPHQILIVDSCSTDSTADLALRAGFRLKLIERNCFNHGGTRQAALAEVPRADVVIYMTQDALPANSSSFVQLCCAFDDPRVAVAYGRQLPRFGARGIERHARLFNYSATSPNT